MSDPQVQICPGHAAALAEGIHWDVQRQRLFWLDILHPWLHWFEPASATAGQFKPVNAVWITQRSSATRAGGW